MPDNRMRICIVGDDLVAGVGDGKGLGWVGRVAARTDAKPMPAFYQLAKPGEVTTDLAVRWEQEALPRFSPDSQGRLVLGLGRDDVLSGLSIARSRLNLANMLDSAESHRLPVLVVGPPPMGPGSGRSDEADRLGELSAAFADVCGRRRVPYVETFEPLRTHEQWLSDLAAGDGVHPGQAGYGLMAWLVLHNGWHSWLGIPSPE